MQRIALSQAVDRKLIGVYGLGDTKYFNSFGYCILVFEGDTYAMIEPTEFYGERHIQDIEGDLFRSDADDQMLLDAGIVTAEEILAAKAKEAEERKMQRDAQDRSQYEKLKRKFERA